MKPLLFATTNSRKISEANRALTPYNITVTPIALDIDEIQHRDPEIITKAKAKAAYEAAKSPIVVSDTSWSIPVLGGFPGGYMKDVSAWFKDTDWLSLMEHHEDRTIYCHEHLAYYDGANLHHFVANYKGVIAREASGLESEDESIERVAIMYGDKTLASIKLEAEVASAGETLEHWEQFGTWYTQNNR